jgi:hypothetical protein
MIFWAELGTWGIKGVQNVPRSGWVKTDAASVSVSTDVAFDVSLAASVFTHALRGTFCIPCTPKCSSLPLAQRERHSLIHLDGKENEQL